MSKPLVTEHWSKNVCVKTEWTAQNIQRDVVWLGDELLEALMEYILLTFWTASHLFHHV